MAAKEKYLIELTNCHVQLEWERRGWIVTKWHTIERHHPTWIHPEEYLLSALMCPPSRPEYVDSEPRLETDRSIQGQNVGTQEWPHPNTATMIGYMLKMEWKTPFLRRLRLISKRRWP